MNFIIPALIILSLCLSSHAKVEGMRTWTNNKNKSLEAALMRVFNDTNKGQRITKATFKLKSGKVIDIPVTSLSATHTKELLGWIKSHPTGVASPSAPYSWPSQYNGSNSPKVVYLKYDTKRKAHLYQTKHFNFYVDTKLSNSTVSKCVAVFDTIVEAIDSLPFQFDTIPKGDRARYEAILVSSRETYMRMGGIPNSGGFFSPGKNLTVIPFSSLGIVQKGNKWVFDGKRRSFGTLLHELTHHSLSQWRGVPAWFQEGFADYMEAMPYQSGRFLFTNTGSAISSKIREYKKYPTGGEVIPKGVFQMIHPHALFGLSRANWNGQMGDRVRSARNYTSSTVLAYYFMHEDGNGDGAHIIQWIHAWRAAVMSGQASQYGALVEKHLLRGRSAQALEKDIQDAMRKKGLRINFAN